MKLSEIGSAGTKGETKWEREENIGEGRGVESPVRPRRRESNFLKDWSVFLKIGRDSPREKRSDSTTNLSLVGEEGGRDQPYRPEGNKKC